VQRETRLLIVLIAVLALSACGRSKLEPVATSAPTQSATVSVATATAASPTAAVAPTIAPTRAASPTPAPATATTRPAPAATAIVRSPTTPPLTPTPLATPTPVPPPTAIAVPPSPTPLAPHVAQLPSSAPRQVVGSATDGLVLLNVRTGTHDGYTRIVFDIAKADGSNAPVPRTKLWTQDGAVILTIDGIRQDAYGDTLGTKDELVNNGSVIALYRIPTMDDATVAYGISTKGKQNASITLAYAPTRLIIDVAD
jgi:hypothetical protein